MKFLGPDPRISALLVDDLRIPAEMISADGVTVEQLGDGYYAASLTLFARRRVEFEHRPQEPSPRDTPPVAAAPNEAVRPPLTTLRRLP